MTRDTKIRLYDRVLYELLKWNKDGIGVKIDKGRQAGICINFLSKKDIRIIKAKRKRLNKIISKLK